MRSRAPATKPAARDGQPLQRKPALRIGEHDDAHEREADRVADAVVAGSLSPGGISLSAISVSPPLQREEGKTGKGQEEEYKEALKKAGEAFLETGPGKELKEKAENLGEAFIATLPGKIITGSAITGAVAALAATHKELPIGIPEIPLDMIRPGLKMKITYDGPVDKPTKVAATFSIPLGAPPGSRKPKLSKSEQFRAETARMALELHQFRESMKTPEQRAGEQALINAWVASQQWRPELPLAPGGSAAPPPPLAPYAPEYRLTGEQPKTSEPEPRKKKEEGAIQRKATNAARSEGTPAVVHQVLESSGRPLEPAARAFMESRFGHDFSQVRVHTDGQAAQSAEAIDALAYTAGNRIVFANGQYAPHTEAGRRLLAHELTHVLQQGGLASAPRRGPVIQRKSNVPVPSMTPAEALAETLEGDDDSVRALTASPLWGAVMLTPAEAALLLIELLDGPTLDDDELAGLDILKKTLAQGMLDDSLYSLWTRNYFYQLLDDYHDIEYVWLLDLLSQNIGKLHVKAIFLDAFIAMWWVNETEEEAIVVLLERTSGKEQHELLSFRDRHQHLREAIDTDALTIRYEAIAGKVNELRQRDIAAQLERLFVVASKDPDATGKRTREETDVLLAAAREDLARELAEILTGYRDKLQEALDADEPDAAAVAQINFDFEAALDGLQKRKQEEFRIELKYGVELNRLVEDVGAPAKSWNVEDLKQIDAILGQIPPEMLSAHPRFRAIERGGKHPKLAGQAPFSGERFYVFGSLSLNTTAHELGHVISFDNGHRLQDEFNDEFEWEGLSADDMTRLIADEQARDALVKKMDEDREAERERKHHRHDHGDHYYRMNRYGGEGDYLRHPKSSCFVSDYAATDRYDDFAECFEAYVVNPALLHRTCPDKYRFMRGRVFTEYLYNKQMPAVLAAFDTAIVNWLAKRNFAGELPRRLQERIFGKLREELKKALKGAGEELGNEALEIEPHENMKRLTLTGMEAEVVARPFHGRLEELFRLLTALERPWRHIRTRLENSKGAAPEKFRKTASIIAAQVGEEFLKDILKQAVPPAERVIAGKKADAAELRKNLQALVEQSGRAVEVIPSYLAAYELVRTTRVDVETDIFVTYTEQEMVGPTAWKYLKQVEKSEEGRKEFKEYIEKRRLELGESLGELQGEMIRQVKAGISLKKSKLTTFDELVAVYEQDIKSYAKEHGLLPGKGKRARRAQPRTVRGSAGTDAREMEAECAADFVIGRRTERPHLSPASSGSPADAGKTGGAPAHLGEVLGSPGQALEPPVRRLMESRFAHEFSRVRIHADSRAAAVAGRAHAAALTAGRHIVFGAGRYRPDTRGGRHLLAHELAHVVQQGREAATGPPSVQRRDAWDDFLVLFGLSEGDFSEDELTGYLEKVTKNGKIEDDYDSDNKARAIVRRWRNAEARFELFPEQKVLLIEEMLSGPTLIEDEEGILDLLELSDTIDLRRMFAPGGANLVRLEEDLDGDSGGRLEAFVASRFKGGRAAVLKGAIEPIGAPGRSAPAFPYQWSSLKSRIEGDYSVEEILELLSRLDSASRDRALQDVGRERTGLQRRIDDLRDAWGAEKDPATRDAIKDEAKALAAARMRLDRILQPVFRDIALTETRAEVLAATTVPTAAEKADILKALKPDVKTTKAGKPKDFEPVLPGETKDYEQKLREHLPTMIQDYYEVMVEGRGRKEHGDSDKVHDLEEFEAIGNVSKRETDALFGSYKTGPALKADTEEKRGNIHDLFADTEADLRDMNRKQRRDLARQLIFYFFQSDGFVRNLNRQHNASPRFGAKNKPLNDEAKSLHKLAVEFTETRKQIRKLNLIDRGWVASAGGGDINIQIFRGKTVEEDRDFLWDMFQTLIHEYLHTLVHDDYEKYALTFGDTSNEYNTLIEGVDSMLTEIVWSNVEPRVNDPALRKSIEGPAYAKLPPIEVKPAARRRYASYTEAIKVVNIVGIRNMYVAYFLGKVDRIGA